MTRPAYNPNIGDLYRGKKVADKKDYFEVLGKKDLSLKDLSETNYSTVLAYKLCELIVVFRRGDIQREPRARRFITDIYAFKNTEVGDIIEIKYLRNYKQFWAGNIRSIYNTRNNWRIRAFRELW